MKARNCLFLALFFILPSCARGQKEVVSAPIGHPCDMTTIDEDPWNCGECTTPEANHVCDVDTSDFTCERGKCVCGNGPPCDERPEIIATGIATECRFGQCIRQEAEGSVCEYDHECSAGYVCISGLCSFMACVPEECDGVDNDCDGVADESDSGTPLTGWCLGDQEADATDAPLPPCQLGYRVCTGGAWGECVGTVGPRLEQGLMGCDGVDNDCDGCVDGSFVNNVCESSETVNLDIVFVLDISGSMSGNIQAMKDAVHDYSEQFPQNPAYKFGTVELAPPGYNADDRPLLVQKLTDFNTFEASLANVPLNGGGSEPQYDSVYELGTEEMPIGWREGSTRVIIVFTDEEGQSYRDRHGLSAVDEAGMCASLTHGEVLVFFTNMMYSADFDDCSMIFEISEDKDILLQNLSLVIQDPC